MASGYVNIITHDLEKDIWYVRCSSGRRAQITDAKAIILTNQRFKVQMRWAMRDREVRDPDTDEVIRRNYSLYNKPRKGDYGRYSVDTKQNRDIDYSEYMEVLGDFVKYRKMFNHDQEPFDT